MPSRLILASTSEIRQTLLRNAGVTFEALAARIDETSIKLALTAEGATPRDIADGLAEFKARKVAQKHPDAMVIGCDQVLNANGAILSKPDTPDHARDQLRALSGKSHQLLSAAVIYDGGEPVWRHVGVVRLQMRELSVGYIDAYVDRNWDSIQHSVGSYKLEEEGVRLFTQIQGDYFNVLGLPLLNLLSYLTLKGILPS